MDISWTCSICVSVNLADFLKIATPTCEICGQKYWWDSLLTEEQMAAGNALLDAELAVINELDYDPVVCLVCGVDIGGGMCDDLSLGYDDNEQEWVRASLDVQNAAN